MQEGSRREEKSRARVSKQTWEWGRHRNFCPKDYARSWVPPRLGAKPPRGQFSVQETRANPFLPGPKHSGSQGWTGPFLRVLIAKACCNEGHPQRHSFFFFSAVRKIVAELTSVPVFFSVVCGTLPQHWLDEWCVGLHPRSEPANRRLLKQSA